MALIRTGGDTSKQINMAVINVRNSQYIDNAVVGDLYIIGTSTLPSSVQGATIMLQYDTSSGGSGSIVLKATASTINLGNSYGGNHCIHVSGDVDIITF